MTDRAPLLMAVDAAPATPAEQSACRLLWISVLLEQIREAAREARREGLPMAACIDENYWFGSRDFYTVCALGGLDGGWVLHRVRQMSGARRDVYQPMMRTS